MENTDSRHPGKPWPNAGARERAVYLHYRDGSTRGYLHDHFKRGTLGTHRPERSHPIALAAWLAGRDAAKDGSVAPAQDHVMGPSRLNHGAAQCVNCHATDLEIVHALGPICPSAPIPAPAGGLKPDDRMVMMLEILQAMGGTSDAGDYKGNWLNAFWEEHEGRTPDSYNMADALGYVSISHDTSTDAATVTLTEAGRALLAGGEHVDPRRALLLDHLSDALFETYDCTRTWEAWSVGTMGPDDFTPAAERIDEIADGILDALGIRMNC